MSHLTQTILEALFNAVVNDVKDGSSKYSKEELMETLYTVSRSVQKLANTVSSESYDRLSLMNEYHISKREFYRLLNNGLLKPRHLPNSTKDVFLKTEMDLLIEKGEVNLLPAYRPKKTSSK